MFHRHGTHVTADMSPEQARKARKWETPAVAVMLALVPTLVARQQEIGGVVPDVVFCAIVAFLVLEAVAMIILAPDNLHWLSKNPLDVAVIIIGIITLPGVVDVLEDAASWAFLDHRLQWLSALMLLRLFDVLPALHARTGWVTETKFPLWVVAVVWLAAGLAFVQIEVDGDTGNPYTLMQALYWSMTTLSTVGYGDISPVTDLGMVVTMAVQITGLCTLALLVGAFQNVAQREYRHGFLSALQRMNSSMYQRVMGDMAQVEAELDSFGAELRQMRADEAAEDEIESAKLDRILEILESRDTTKA